jgi:disulfide oxidoreductase YuzD
MMISYVNVFGLPKVKLPLEVFIPQLEEKVWGDWSPLDVLKNLDLKKYKEDAEQIQKADLAYPVIVTGKHKIVDGYHRVAKAYLEGKKNVDVYIFNSDLMNKFIINRDLDFVKVHDHTNIHELLEIWTRRFCKG